MTETGKVLLSELILFELFKIVEVLHSSSLSWTYENINIIHLFTIPSPLCLKLVTRIKTQEWI